MNKVAIVTGASRGIGAATAIALARDGHSVVVNYLKESNKADTVVDIIKKNGGNAIAIEADVGDEKQVITLFDKTQSALGSPTILINNAGINGHVGALETLVFEDLLSVYKTNVFGIFLCCRELIKRTRTDNLSGNIVNITSEAAKFGGNMMTPYASSKAAISTLTVGLAREVAKYNIRVNAVSPSVIKTELHAQASEERMNALKNSIPLGRLGTPEEVAETVCWLVSEKASYLSGSIITVSGAR